MTRCWLVTLSLALSSSAFGCGAGASANTDPKTVEQHCVGAGDYEVLFTSGRGRPGPHPPPTTQLRPKVGSVGRDGERLVVVGVDP